MPLSLKNKTNKKQRQNCGACGREGRSVGKRWATPWSCPRFFHHGRDPVPLAALVHKSKVWNLSMGKVSIDERKMQGLPAWISSELIEDTIRVWQPYYDQPLTVDDAIQILLCVDRVVDVLQGS